VINRSAVTVSHAANFCFGGPGEAKCGLEPAKGKSAMHKPILACMFMCLGLALTASAQGETWYLRNAIDSPSQGVAAPLDYCLRAIAITGGVCARHNDQRSEQEQAPQSPRRAEQQRRDRRDRSER
jgi:hypothetical protein